MLYRDFGSDHLHPTTYNNDSESFEHVAYPDWESIDFNVDGLLPEEGTATFSDMSAALSLVLGWCCGAQAGTNKTPILTAGMRVQSLLYWLSPTDSPFSSLEAIADASGLTRQAVSKALAGLRAQLSGILPLKRSYSSDVYRKAQAAALAAGVHASQVRRDLNPERKKHSTRKQAKLERAAA